MFLANKLSRKFKHFDPLEILIQSLKNKSVKEKIEIAKSSDIPSEILIQLSKDKDRDVRNVAICSLKRV